MSAMEIGLHVERTELAWRRTLLSAVLVITFTARAALLGTNDTAYPFLLLACVLAGVVLAVWLGTRSRIVKSSSVDHNHKAWLLPSLSASISILSLACLFLALHNGILRL